MLFPLLLRSPACVVIYLTFMFDFCIIVAYLKFAQQFLDRFNLLIASKSLKGYSELLSDVVQLVS